MYNPEKPANAAIIKLMRRTWQAPSLLMDDQNGFSIRQGFGYTKDSVDGIGTKGICLRTAKAYAAAARTAFNNNANDLAMDFCVPFRMTDHIFYPADEPHALVAMVRECCRIARARGITITAGETAIHDDMAGLEISVMLEGWALHPGISNCCLPGDILVGIASNGLHSNGFTLVRALLSPLTRRAFIKPPPLYLDAILGLDPHAVHGRQHITGGAFTKLRGMLPRNCTVVIRRPKVLKPHRIFWELYRKGVSDYDMYRTFNCGIGFVLSVEPCYAEECMSRINLFKTEIIGSVVRSRKRSVLVESSFSKTEIEY